MWLAGFGDIQMNAMNAVCLRHRYARLTPPSYLTVAMSGNDPARIKLRYVDEQSAEIRSNLLWNLVRIEVEFVETC